MNAFRARSIPVLLLAAVASSAAPAAAQGGFGPGKTDSRQVTLDHVGGELCATVYPDPATIWRPGKKSKIRKVDWVVVDEEDYYWEIRYAPEKPGAEEDYFESSAPIDIPCGDNLFRSKNPRDPGKDGTAWPYTVTVYSCVDGQRGELLCVKDPEIDWGT